MRALSEDVVGDIGRMLSVILGTVGMVLLIACANVANLCLVHTEGRQEEFAVRAALGASRRQIARTLLSESLALGLVGGVLGVGLAQAGLSLLLACPVRLAAARDCDQRACPRLPLVISLVAGALFGLIPVLRFGERRIAALKEGGRSASEGPTRHRARNTLVVAEIALALVLLVVSGLMVRSFQALRPVDPGFRDPEQVQTFRIAVPEAVVANPDQAARTHQQIAEQLARVPGVQSVGFSSSLTMDGYDSNDPNLMRERVAHRRINAATPPLQVDRPGLLRDDGQPGPGGPDADLERRVSANAGRRHQREAVRASTSRRRWPPLAGAFATAPAIPGAKSWASSATNGTTD